MLFTNKRFRVQNNHFLQNYNVGFGILEMVKVGKYVFPYVQSSIDLSKKMAYIKGYNEYLERTRIGFNKYFTRPSNAINIIAKTTNEVNRKDIAYGFNPTYGVLDTTGTASGFGSHRLRHKALSELLEKNEVMLVWYRKNGHNIVPCDFLHKIIASIGFHSEKLFIYCSSNLSSGVAVIVLAFNNQRLVSSGVSLSNNFYEALHNSLLEAKMMERMFRDETISPYYSFSIEEHREFYDYCSCLENSMEPKDLAVLGTTYNEQNTSIRMVDWVSEIVFTVLNTHNYQDGITIRCMSKDLINCLPSKDNILNCASKRVLDRYKIVESFVKTPDCIIL